MQQLAGAALVVKPLYRRLNQLLVVVVVSKASALCDSVSPLGIGTDPMPFSADITSGEVSTLPVMRNYLGMSAATVPSCRRHLW